MRTRKHGAGSGRVETLYLHDGQMPVEETTFSWSSTRGSTTEVVRNGLGARGIDVMEKTNWSGGNPTSSVSYPMYDGHGNMLATISKNGSGFAFANQRGFDPWGTVRAWASGNYNGHPSGRYVANLGHQMDDESGLIYMRARYYEPGSGRFISEDLAMDGLNWLSYCGNDPINRIDRTGNSYESTLFANGCALTLALITMATVLFQSAKGSFTGFVIAFSGFGFICLWMGGDGYNTSRDYGDNFLIFLKSSAFFMGMMLACASPNYFYGVAPRGIAGEVMGACAAYGAVIGLFLCVLAFEEAYEG